MSAQPCEGTDAVQVVDDPRRNQTARAAWLSVRRVQVQIQRPDNRSAPDDPASVTLSAVEAQEVNPPPHQKPIHWRLLTTHSGVCLEQALQVLPWYCWRWRLEQLFATVKQAGRNLEATPLESVEAIQRLTMLSLSIAVRTLQLVEGRNRPDLPAALAWTDEQQHCRTQLEPTLQGQTQKQPPPHPPPSLAWATWVLARLGGWSGYRSQRPPGRPTLVQGLRQFESIVIGWKRAQSPLVCTR